MQDSVHTEQLKTRKHGEHLIPLAVEYIVQMMYGSTSGKMMSYTIIVVLTAMTEDHSKYRTKSCS